MTAGIGHNGPPAQPDVLNQTAQSQIRSVVERVERLMIERGEINEQISEVFAEAKGNGFDVPTLRSAIKIRAMDRAKRQEQEAQLDLYLVALGEAEPFVRASPASPPPADAPSEEDFSDLA